MSKKIKILFCAAEASPLAKVGGLGDVIGSLPKVLNKIGLEARLILPFYAPLAKKYRAKLLEKDRLVELDGHVERFSIYQLKLPASSVWVYLVKHKFFDSPEIYFGSKTIRVGSRHIGDLERFTFFSKAIVESLRFLDWQPDILHCHDWHTALVPTFLDEYALKYTKFPNPKTLLTIHNLASQGKAGLDILDYAGLHRDLTPAVMEDYYDQDGQILDFLKIGILSADYISTVSPSYAKEILTKEYGEHLEKYLLRRRQHLVGIVKGIDTDFFDPYQDKFIYQKYSVKNFQTGKAINKAKLQKFFALPVSSKTPLFGLVTRLFAQKGLDILLPALENILATGNLQLVALGSGLPEYEQALRDLQKKYPTKVALNIGFDERLAQRIYAASDFFLMPSAFEPCGLGQLIATRYGAIPLVRATGGLRDTVKSTQGLVFQSYSSSELIKTIRKALRAYQSAASHHQMIKRDMQLDFSWKQSAQNYKKLYQKII